MKKSNHVAFEWSTNQEKAIELLARGGQTYEAIAEQCNVSPHAIYHWRQDPGFMEEVIRRARKNLKAELPDIYLSLSQAAKRGDSRHIKLVLDHIEKLEEMKARYAENAISFTWEQEYAPDNS